MRIIKFRSWDGRNKQMDYPDNIANGIDGDKYQIMQFTGLHDKNGKEIYEGDIVSEGDNYPSVVQWNNESACFELWEQYPRKGGEKETFDRYHEMTAYTDGVGEVIGNIYENPKLIQRSQLGQSK